MCAYCETCFQKLKSALIQKPILKLYDPKSTCHLFVSASSHGVGCVLKQEDEESILHLVAHHSGICKFRRSVCKFYQRSIPSQKPIGKFRRKIFFEISCTCISATTSTTE